MSGFTDSEYLGHTSEQYSEISALTWSSYKILVHTSSEVAFPRGNVTIYIPRYNLAYLSRVDETGMFFYYEKLLRIVTAHYCGTF